MVTQADKILDLLESRNELGATNIELNRIAFRYGARLHELRKDYRISTIYIKPGVFKFICHGPKESEWYEGL